MDDMPKLLYFNNPGAFVPQDFCLAEMKIPIFSVSHLSKISVTFSQKPFN
jgi:hypothetical protein